MDEPQWSTRAHIRSKYQCYLRLCCFICICDEAVPGVDLESIWNVEEVEFVAWLLFLVVVVIIVSGDFFVMNVYLA